MQCRWTMFAAIFLLISISVAGVASAKDKDDKKDSGKSSARSDLSNRINAAREQASKSARGFENRSGSSEPKFSGGRSSGSESKFRSSDGSSTRSFAAEQGKQSSKSSGAQSFGGTSGNRNRFDSSNNPARTFTPNTQPPSTGNPTGGNPSVRSFPSGGLGQGNRSNGGSTSNSGSQFPQRGSVGNAGSGNIGGSGTIRPYQPNDPTGNAIRTLTPNTVNRPKVIDGVKPETKLPSGVVGDPNRNSGGAGDPSRNTGGINRPKVGGTPFNPNPGNTTNPSGPTGPTIGNPGNLPGGNPVVGGDRTKQTFPSRDGGNTARNSDNATGKPNYKTPDIVDPNDPRFDRSRVGSNDKPGKPDKSDKDGPVLGDGRNPVVRDASGKTVDGRGPDNKSRDFDRDGKPGNRIVGDSNRFYDNKRDDNRVHRESKIKDVSKTSWAKRIDGDRIDRLAVGSKTEKLRLDKQFELQHRGDISRQMNLREHLHSHGGWDKRPFYGPVHASYRDRSFHRSYCGPSWYPSRCWYPSWNSWVNWSWYFNVSAIWDPRPVFCRPVVYQPAVAWVYYPYPVWQPLPVAASGTWVDVPQVPVQRDDLQLLAVRFVDPGHPGNDLGARYRVWVRNNSTDLASDPFNVVVMGTRGQQVTDARLEAGVRVPSIEPNQILPIDIRLPLNMPSGDPLDFDMVHVLVDSHRELNEGDETNNGAVLARGDIEPVDPAVFSADADVVLAGAVVNLAGEGLGPEPGEVILQIGDQQSQVEVVGWYDLGVQVRIPQVALNNLTGAELMIVRGDGAASNPLPVQMASSDSGETY